MGKPNKAGVDKDGYIIEKGYFPEGALAQLNKGRTAKKPANSKRTSPVTKKGKK